MRRSLRLRHLPCLRRGGVARGGGTALGDGRGYAGFRLRGEGVKPAELPDQGETRARRLGCTRTRKAVLTWARANPRPADEGRGGGLVVGRRRRVARAAAAVGALACAFPHSRWLRPSRWRWWAPVQSSTPARRRRNVGPRSTPTTKHLRPLPGPAARPRHARRRSRPAVAPPRPAPTVLPRPTRWRTCSR